MPIDRPNTWLQGATALKTGFDAVCSAVGLAHDAEKALGGGKVHKKVINQPLDHAVSTAAIAETEIAKAIG